MTIDTPGPAVPPTAERRPIQRTHHGDTVEDPYEWLREKNDPAVLAHLEAENAFTTARTERLAPLREQIYQEISDRTQQTDLSVPARRGDWWYYARTLTGAQYPIMCRAPLADPDDWTPPQLAPGVQVPGEQVLLDGNAEAAGHEFFSLGSFDVSADGTRLLFAVDPAGDERYTIAVRDLVTGQTLPDEIPATAAGAEFSPDGTSIIYTTVDDAWRPDTVWRHVVGSPVAEDQALFRETDERFRVGAGFTRSGAFLQIVVASSITSETALVPADDLGATPTVVWPRTEGVEYSVDHARVDGRDVLYVLHNDGALDFELVRVPVADPTGPRHVVLAHTPGVRLLEVDCFGHWAVVEYRRAGLARIGILDYTTDALRELVFDEPLYAVGSSANREWTPPVVRLGFTSFVTPSTVYDYDVAADRLLLRKRQAVLGGYDPGDYAQSRVWVTARDGAQVPVSLVWKTSFGEPGERPRPLHLYGYGSYEYPIEPGFSVARLSELDRGAVFAVAHVRGGGEMGRHWYEEGKLLAKRTTFTDFIDCAAHLVSSGVTTPQLLVAEGGSAGGLLMGAVANMAPELFAGILAAVPFVDALTSMLDPTLPLTVIEWDEWGDPLHDPEVYRYMKSYSPYENVHDTTYPRILAVTSLNDTRVLYVEPAKWVARLREVDADVLLKCEMVAGHGGVSGRYEKWEQRAFELAWLLDVMGLADR